jgi:hypothetical protein
LLHQDPVELADGAAQKRAVEPRGLDRDIDHAQDDPCVAEDEWALCSGS